MLCKEPGSHQTALTPLLAPKLTSMTLDKHADLSGSQFPLLQQRIIKSLLSKVTLRIKVNTVCRVLSMAASMG